MRAKTSPLHPGIASLFPGVSPLFPGVSPVLPRGASVFPGGAFVLPGGAFVLPGGAFVLPGGAFVLPGGAGVRMPCRIAARGTIPRLLALPASFASIVIDTASATANYPVAQSNYIRLTTRRACTPTPCTPAALHATYPVYTITSFLSSGLFAVFYRVQPSR